MDYGLRPPKVAICDLKEFDSPIYAVFLRTPSGRAARFVYAHDTLESAIERCREYASRVASTGKDDFTYYAIEIKHRVGIENGKLVDEPLK